MAEPALSVIETAPTPHVVDQVLAIPLVDIVVGDRLRPVDPIHMQALAGLMGRDGQDTAVEVCRLPGRADWMLVTGGHRLAAAAYLGWLTIKAIVVSADALGRRRKEISENLFRSGLNPIDRATFVAELVTVMKLQAGVDPAKDGRAISAQMRWQKALADQAADATETISVAYGFTDEIGDRLGLTGRTIRNDLLLHRGLPAHLVARLRGHPIARNAGQLRALAKMTPADQAAVVQLLLDGKAKGATDALGLLRQKPKPDAEKKAWSAFFGGWSRMNARKRRDALREMAAQGLPSGVRIIFDGDA